MRNWRALFASIPDPAQREGSPVIMSWEEPGRLRNISDARETVLQLDWKATHLLVLGT